MVMTEVFERLKELQGVLAEKYMLEEKIEEAPKQLTSQDELLARLKKEYIEKNTKYDEVRASVEHLKAQLAEAEASRESGEKGMDSITTHREYEALDKQITEAKEREDAIRRDLTREEKTLAELNEILRTDEAMITAQEADLDSSRTSLAAEIDGYKQALGDLDKKEADITPGIDQEIVYKFQRIIRRNSEGIVAVKNGVCMGCHMILPAQFANEVRDGEKILFCPYCSRILYHQ
ncbi:MAG: nucleic acid-binding protein, partial [Treponemataceae bacterium]|nr:nucleic acid-binding protein [Treponemataceae bacterium]